MSACVCGGVSAKNLVFSHCECNADDCRGPSSYVDYNWNRCKLVLWGILIQAFSLSSDSNASLSRKNLTKQLILTEQDQFLCQCEAAISIQQQPLQADWLTYQWFWQMSKRKSRRRRPLSTVYIFLYIFKLRFNLHSHLSFDSFLLTHGKIKNCCCGSIIGKSGCQSPPALHIIFFYRSVDSL